MSITQHTLTISTPGRSMVDITHKINALVKQTGIMTGLCHLFLQHTSASLVICENADPDVQSDLEAFMQRLVPDGDRLFKHTAEGLDDMPSHVRSILTQSALSIPIAEQCLALGRWQGVYIWEHRFKSYERKVVVTLQH